MNRCEATDKGCACLVQKEDNGRGGKVRSRSAAKPGPLRSSAFCTTYARNTGVISGLAVRTRINFAKCKHEFLMTKMTKNHTSMQKCWPVEATVTILSEDILHVKNSNLQGSSVLKKSCLYIQVQQLKVDG